MVDARVGCTLEFEVRQPAELHLQVAVCPRPGVTVTRTGRAPRDPGDPGPGEPGPGEPGLGEPGPGEPGGDRPEDIFDVRLDGAPVQLRAVAGGHYLSAGPGLLRIEYSADVTVRRVPPQRLDLEQRIAATRPSRYCPSDRLAGFAAREFQHLASSPADTVAGIVDYVHRHTRYEAGTSSGTTDATDTLLGGAGVCRDFAHLVAALARSVNIPARTAAVYAPGLSPMDFHAVVEVAVDDEWRVVDATGLAPRQSLIRIATGADAAETAFASVLTGTADLTSMEVRAITTGELPTDDGTGVIHLP